MPGLVPGNHILRYKKDVVDDRVEPGHDGVGIGEAT
jgi:hypothetical protein